MSPPQSAATAVEDQKPGTETVATAAASAPTEAAKLVPATSTSLNRCAARLRSGSLVAFPTETVYGLGCHALDPNAVAKIFEAKERPRTDPLIVHVTKAEEALDLWSGCAEDGDGAGGSNSAEAQVLQSLTTRFFPGPLTLVAKARTSVPPIVTAGTGYVACRSPSHPIARALIGAAGIPIAAPSANKFGHVSPTRAQHVYDDLGKEDVWIVDPTTLDENGEGDAEEEGAAATATQHVCDVGVESTVAKLEMSSPSSGTVTVLRHGAVSASDMRQCLEHSGLADRFAVESVIQSTKENVATVAPGQTVRHYSPDVVSYLIAHGRYSSKMDVTEEEKDLLSNAVVIDFGGRLSALEHHALAYRDLSSGGKSSEAASRVFETLRWSETVEGTERVYFPELVTLDGKDNRDNNEEEGVDALILAVKDRLTRAASGVVIETLR